MKKTKMKIPKLPDILNPCHYGYHLWHKHTNKHDRETRRFISYRECLICKQKQIKEDIYDIPYEAHDIPYEATDYHEGTWRNLK